MDFEYLQKLFNQIEAKKQIAHNIADYIVTNSLNIENDIAKLMQKQFQNNFFKQKVAIFMVINQIFLITASQSDKRFFKALSQKAKTFLEELSRRCNQLLPEYILILAEILNRWFTPNRQIFVPAFTQKLRKVSEPIIDSARKIQEEKRNGIFENYTKTFLMEYQDIKSYDPTSRIYDDFQKYDAIAKEIGEINQQTKRLSLEQPTPEIRERAKVLKNRLQSFTQKLESLICNYHVDFKLLREACREQFQKLPSEAKKVLQAKDSS